MKELKIAQSYTNRTESLDAYLKMVNKEPMIGIEDEVKLAERIHKGDERALDKLVRANLRFAFSIAKQYQNRGLDLMDIVDEANIGLITAANRFDETRGFKFISYAVWWIRQQILLALAEHGNIVRRPLNHLNNISKVNKAIAEFEQTHERAASADEIAEMTNLPEDKVLIAITGGSRAVSVDAPINPSEDFSLLDTLNSDIPSTDNSMMQESLQTDINQVLDTLSLRDRTIICMSFGIGGQQHTLEEIGCLLNISRERVRQIKEKTIRSLRTNPNLTLLKPYLC